MRLKLYTRSQQPLLQRLIPLLETLDCVCPWGFFGGFFAIPKSVKLWTSCIKRESGVYEMCVHPLTQGTGGLWDVSLLQLESVWVQESGARGLHGRVSFVGRKEASWSEKDFLLCLFGQWRGSESSRWCGATYTYSMLLQYIRYITAFITLYYTRALLNSPFPLVFNNSSFESTPVSNSNHSFLFEYISVSIVTTKLNDPHNRRLVKTFPFIRTTPGCADSAAMQQATLFTHSLPILCVTFL